jgi:hypothetical protein
MLKEKNTVRPCTCGHDMLNHKHMDKSPEQLLQMAVKSNLLEIIHNPDSMKPHGYKSKNDYMPLAFWEHDKMLEWFKDFQKMNSYCMGKMFSMCTCKMFKLDNLKYLEGLSECAASQTIY